MLIEPVARESNRAVAGTRGKRHFAALATAGILLLVVGTSAFLLSACTGGASQPRQQQEGRPQQSQEVTLPLHPNNGSGVRGTATFRGAHNGGAVLVKLKLHNLPKANAFYLAHIHPGTCAQGEQEEEEEGHGEQHKGAAAAKEIEWPLLPVRSGTHGNGSSTTTLKHTSMEKLFSGHSKHVNVHAVGSGNPPVLACANLKSQSSSPVQTTKPQTASPTSKSATSSSSAVASASSSASLRGGSSGGEQAEQLSEADCRVAIYVAQKRMSRQKAHAFSNLLADMIRTMEGLGWPEGTLRNAALDHLGVPRYSECKKVGRE